MKAVLTAELYRKSQDFLFIALSLSSLILVAFQIIVRLIIRLNNSLIEELNIEELNIGYF